LLELQLQAKGFSIFYCAGCTAGSEAALAQELLQPLVVGLWSNAERMNKRQAAVVMGHIDQSGAAASELVKTFASNLKVSEPPLINNCCIWSCQIHRQTA
jgi:hypothetical protein